MRRQIQGARVGDEEHLVSGVEADLPRVRQQQGEAERRVLISRAMPSERVVVAGGIVKPTACACAHRRQGASLRSAPAPRGGRP